MTLLERADRSLDPAFDAQLSVSEVVLVPRRGAAAAVDPAWIERLDARQIIVSAAEFDAKREGRVRALWRVGPEQIHATARDGALSVVLRARLPAQVFRQSELRRRYVWDGPA